MYTLTMADKERLKDYALKLIGTDKVNTKEQLYTRIRTVAKLLSDINETQVKEMHGSAVASSRTDKPR
ncbi:MULTISPECIES: hypothetical protein [Vitreoscilla]|uniref:Uncharacterized protein n=1 Tax=Vitreoscilla stercoraria TaxID=61 RepID=A0ABY4E7B4_VITST|nr:MULTISPECIES: hypothetical protein [Vitreoscilla]UOO91651.1 hypothetical protein LVJ81_08335 [Vitreoscilla stercoraria]